MSTILGVAPDRSLNFLCPIEALLREDAGKLAQEVGLENVDPEQSRSFESAQQV
jgi:hypothetical protein